jgi:hypothetical protein
MIGHQLLELLAGVLAAAIGVMQQRIGLASVSNRIEPRPPFRVQKRPPSA